MLDQLRRGTASHIAERGLAQLESRQDAAWPVETKGELRGLGRLGGWVMVDVVMEIDGNELEKKPADLVKLHRPKARLGKVEDLNALGMTNELEQQRRVLALERKVEHQRVVQRSRRLLESETGE